MKPKSKAQVTGKVKAHAKVKDKVTGKEKGNHPKVLRRIIVTSLTCNCKAIGLPKARPVTVTTFCTQRAPAAPTQQNPSQQMFPTDPHFAHMSTQQPAPSNCPTSTENVDAAFDSDSECSDVVAIAPAPRRATADAATMTERWPHSHGLSEGAGQTEEGREKERGDGWSGNAFDVEDSPSKSPPMQSPSDGSSRALTTSAPATIPDPFKPFSRLGGCMRPLKLMRTVGPQEVRADPDSRPGTGAPEIDDTGSWHRLEGDGRDATPAVESPTPPPVPVPDPAAQPPPAHAPPAPGPRPDTPAAGIPPVSFVFRCEACPATYPKFVALQNHFSAEHPTAGPCPLQHLTCPTCGNRYLAAKSLRVHLPKCQG